MATEVRPDPRGGSELLQDDAQIRHSRSIHPKPKLTRRRTWWKWTLVACCLTVVGASAFYLLGGIASDRPLPTLTHTIGRRDLQVSVTEQGTLESSNNTEVRNKVKGATNTIVSIVKNGTEVKAGDVLVKIDTSTIETNINTQEIAYQNALALYAQAQSDVAVAEINVTEYVEGTYRSSLLTKEKDVAIKSANLRSAQNMLDHAKAMFRKGFVSKLELEGNEYSLQQAQLELQVAETDVEVLKQFTRAKQLQDLNGILAAKRAKLASDKAALDLEKSKLDRERRQLENCTIVAPTSGMVTYSRGEEWEDRPDIREGATVREDQVLLLIPDLDHMQVKVGIHEATIGEIKPGMAAQIELQSQTYHGEVLSIAPMAQRAGWWNGNMVKYDTLIKLNTKDRLKPGMSATVKIYLAQYQNELTIPVGAVVEMNGEYLCWVVKEKELERRILDLGESDEQYLIVKEGVEEGEVVVLNPMAYVEQAKNEVLKPYSGIKAKSAENSPAPVSETSTDASPDNAKKDSSTPDDSRTEHSTPDHSNTDHSQASSSMQDDSSNSGETKSNQTESATP